MLLFARAVDRDLNHDEHQFLAPGALLAREGLLPYRDYPLFHLPNLVFVYAAADRLTGDPILGPKLVSFASTWLAAGVILLVALGRNRHGPLAHILTGAAILGFLLFDPVAIYSTGKTWNHELPALLLVLAVLFHVEALRRDSAGFIALSGAACGLAIGTRLTFLPCLLPLFGLIFFFPLKMPRRLGMAAAFTGATTLALAPSLWFLATAPEPFFFGNLEFPRLRLLDPENTRIRKTMSVWRKLRYFLKEIVLPGWPLFLSFAAVTIPGIRRWFGAGEPARSGVLVVIWTALFVIVGCFLPSRYQYQHFYALIPLLVLALALTGHEEESHQPRALLLPLGFGVLAAATVALAVLHPTRGNDPFPDWQDVTQRGEWFSSKAAKAGDEIRRALPAGVSSDGRILTLAPAWPLAGGLRIYPEFATGPFAWRSAPFVALPRREKFGIIGPDDLPSFLDTTPPAGILTGVEDDDLETPFIAYAKSRGYTPINLSHKRQLWRR